MKEPPEFVNREKEIESLKRVLWGRPNVIWFVYGPINSGKTALISKVIEELPEDYCVFYINFRWRYVENLKDLVQVLFEVRFGEEKEKFREVIKEFLKEGVRALKRGKGIPIPEKIFEYLFQRGEKIEDVFRYLERVFEIIKEEGYAPVFILDEMQSIKEIINSSGRPVFSELFNFLVGMTKEKHLCHCLCVTSDCLFIESVYSNARLEGRAEYFLVDDLEREKAFEVYQAFGFEEKELIWDYIGGKIGDIIRVFEEKKRGYTEREAVEIIFKDEVRRLEWLEAKVFRERKDGKDLWEFLKKFEQWENKVDLREDFEKLIYWVGKNVLFYDPLKGILRPQSQLLWRAIKEVVK